MFCEVFRLCSVRFLVLDLAGLQLASWFASLAGACLPGPRYMALALLGGKITDKWDKHRMKDIFSCILKILQCIIKTKEF